jgi:phosphatidylserine synthase
MQRAKFALPSMVTLMSIACGFGSIVISVDNALVGSAHDYRLAAVLLVLAGVFDALDGMVARATNTQSDFGMQLDSIADVMNFGCAPGCCCTAGASSNWAWSIRRCCAWAAWPVSSSPAARCGWRVSM